MLSLKKKDILWNLDSLKKKGGFQNRRDSSITLTLKVTASSASKSPGFIVASGEVASSLACTLLKC